MNKMKDSTNKQIDQLNVKDVILVLCLLLVAGICYLVFHYSNDGEKVVIRLNGQQYGVYDINENQTIYVESGESVESARSGESNTSDESNISNASSASTKSKVSEKDYNIVVIENGEVYIKDANCPDKYCMKQGKTKDANKSLICLPHKLVVEVHKDAEETLDAVSQ